jgi:hypothetical protein
MTRQTLNEIAKAICFAGPIALFVFVLWTQSPSGYSL